MKLYKRVGPKVITTVSRSLPLNMTITSSDLQGHIFKIEETL
jgi:hypothetical protein